MWWIMWGVVAVVGVYGSLRVSAAVAERLRSKRERTVFMGKWMSHRGGRETTPENTMAAFENSVKHVDSIELDVWLSKDNKVVVFHDGKLDRMCGMTGHVNDMNYMDLPAVHKRASEGYHQGSENPSIPDRVPIPLFQEVLDLVCKEENKHVTLLIEFKQNSELLAQLVRKMVIERGLLEQRRAVWFSLKHSICKTLDRVDPDFPRSPSVLEIVLYATLYRLGLLSLASLKIQAYGITCGTAESLAEFIHKIPVVRSFPVFLQAAIARWYLGLLGDPGLFAAMKARGLECWVLGVNSDDDIAFAERMGAQCLITDRPEWIKARK